MNKLLTIAATLVLSLIAGFNSALMAKEQSPNLKIQLGSSQFQPVVQSDLQAESQPAIEAEQSTTPTPPLEPCLACGMG